ncbi:MAG: hypothetical protein KDA87_13415 [Planctomycetales bacterium]|nr:hypothetical protein [Planctomycetales bacterium]
MNLDVRISRPQAGVLQKQDGLQFTSSAQLKKYFARQNSRLMVNIRQPELLNPQFSVDTLPVLSGLTCSPPRKTCV